MSQDLSDVRKFFSNPDASDAIVVAAQQIAAPLVLLLHGPRGEDAP